MDGPLKISGGQNHEREPPVQGEKVSYFHTQEIQGTPVILMAGYVARQTPILINLIHYWLMGEKVTVSESSGQKALSEELSYGFGPRLNHLTEQDRAKNLARTGCPKLPSFLESKVAHLHLSP